MLFTCRSLPTVGTHQFHSFAIQFTEAGGGHVSLTEGSPGFENWIHSDALDGVFMVGRGVTALVFVGDEEVKEAGSGFGIAT